MDKMTKKHILASFAESISFILASTHHSTVDERCRGKVAGSIAAAIRQSKTRNGNVRMPKQTDIYKLAVILKDANSWDSFAKRVKAAFPKGKSRYSPYTMLERFDLDWKHNFDIPDRIEKKSKAATEPKTVIKEVDLTPQPHAVKYLTNEEFDQICHNIAILREENTKLRKAVKSIIRDHVHIDGAVKILKEIDL